MVQHVLLASHPCLHAHGVWFSHRMWGCLPYSPTVMSLGRYSPMLVSTSSPAPCMEIACARWQGWLADGTHIPSVILQTRTPLSIFQLSTIVHDAMQEGRELIATATLFRVHILSHCCCWTTYAGFSGCPLEHHDRMNGNMLYSLNGQTP